MIASSPQITRTRVFVAIAALLALAAVAVVILRPGAATHSRRVAGRGLAAGPRGLVPAAAGYLGIGVAKLRESLRAGDTLDVVAERTRGRSSAGLLRALLASRTAAIDQEASAGRLTPAQKAQLLALLRGRLVAELDTPVGRGRARVVPELGVAARYVGVSRAQLRELMHRGNTLAEIAAARGRSAAGLLGALVAARRSALDSAVAAGELSHEREAQLLASFTRRARAEIDG